MARTPVISILRGERNFPTPLTYGKEVNGDFSARLAALEAELGRKSTSEEAARLYNTTWRDNSGLDAVPAIWLLTELSES